MSFFQPSQINTNAVCVLKKRDNGEMFIAYEPLVTPIQAEISQLENSLRFATQTRAKELYAQIKEHPIIKSFFMIQSTFCDDLIQTWQEDYSEKRLEQIFSSQSVDKVAQLKLFVLAFKLHHTYENCKTDSQILAYSHRMKGWCTFTHQLNDHFKVDFETNFGYGIATFFCIRLNFKGIDIVPLTHWVHYQIVNQYEVIRCSQQYAAQHENWFRAMDYVKTACNLYLLNETAFVNQYILGECKQFVKELHKIISQNIFTFITSGYHFVIQNEEKKLLGEELISYRASKISGSLTFVKYIQSYGHITDISNVIEDIEKLNLSIRPVIESAILRLTQLLEPKQRKMTGLYILYHELRDENTQLYNERQRIQQEMYKLEKYHSDFTEEEFNLQYPGYKKFKIKYDANLKLFTDLSKEIDKLEAYINQYNENLAVIDAYFEAKNTN